MVGCAAWMVWYVRNAAMGEDFGSGETLWVLEAFRRRRLKTEKYWQDTLDDYMGMGGWEGWEGHCDEHECCAQEENSGWRVL